MYCPFILVDVCVACVFYKVAHNTNLFMHSELFVVSKPTIFLVV